MVPTRIPPSPTQPAKIQRKRFSARPTLGGHGVCCFTPLPGGTTAMTLGKIAKHGLRALGLVCGLALAGLAGTARAESARLNMDAHLRARAGEKAPTVMKLKEGQTVRILGEEGRWLKVSYRGKVGYITRTQVDREESAEPPVTAARESRTRARDPKSNEGLRRQDKDKDKDKDKKDWDSLDDDATGEAGGEQDDVEEKT